MPTASSDHGILLDHSRIIKDETLEMIMTYLGADPEDALKKIEDTWGCYARFVFLERLYEQQLPVVE